LNRKREIDGLRALAVLPVILFHADVSIFSGGFVGVDVFFIISGYLITSIVIAELELGTFSLIHFYERRCRRILPALYAALILITPFAWVVLPPAELAEYSKSLAAVPLFVSNFHFASSGNYFETAAELKPLLHTWSLAVEEQYYLVFPIFLALIWRVGKRKVALTIFAIGITSLLAAQVGSTYKPIPNFFLLPTRIWELALGGLIAFYRSSSHVFKPSRRLNELLSGCGFLLLTSSFFYFNKNIPYPSLYTLIPTMGTLLLLLYSNENTIIGRVLSCKVMVYIGLISYSAYLWHQPVLALSRYYFITLNNIQIIVLLAIITICAIISYRFIETPFRNINLISTKYVFILSIGVGIIIVVFGVLSIKIFDPYSGYGNEARMAQVLTNSKAIYISNVDERLLVKNRIEYNDDSPEAIVLGSSRIMQIGTHNYDKSVINLGVSGASIEDHIAIASLAAPKLDPKTIFIGLDPWLFNADSKQDRWRSLAPEYYSAWYLLTKKPIL
jgi:peptidoglycan/LPS O-acetylase OafA/YrhL